MFKSKNCFLIKKVENPKIVFIQLRKKKVGVNKYNKINKNKDKIGNKSKKKVKNRNSAIKNIDPGKPKKINKFIKIIKKSLGHKKFNPLISFINRVLNLLFIASTNKNEFVDNKA